MAHFPIDPDVDDDARKRYDDARRIARDWLDTASSPYHGKMRLCQDQDPTLDDVLRKAGFEHDDHHVHVRRGVEYAQEGR